MDEIKIIKNETPVTAVSPHITQSGDNNIAIGHLNKLEAKIYRYENNEEFPIAQLDIEAQFYNLLITNKTKILIKDEIIFKESDFFKYTNKALYPQFFNKTESAKNMIYSFPTLLLPPIDITTNKEFTAGLCQIYSIQETCNIYKIQYHNFSQIECELIKNNLENLNLIIKKRNSELNYPHFAIKKCNLNSALGGVYDK